MKKILIINGNPLKDSYSCAIIDSYIEGVGDKAQVRTLTISDLCFNTNLKLGYRSEQTLEPDLINAQELIKWADHLVWVFPVWWGSIPALLKGFIDRTFLPGFAFKYKENSLMWDKFLSGKTAHIFVTMDSPVWYYKYLTGNPVIKQMKRATLNFCGIKPVKVDYLGMLRKSKKETREKYLLKVKKSGMKLF